MILANHGIISSSAQQTTLLTNLYAVYKAESNANDSLGTYNGTAQGGLTYTAGKSGNAFNFNGSNAYVGLPNDSYNNLTGDFSISFWVNYSALSGNQGIFSDFTYNGTNLWGTGITTIGDSLLFRISNGTATVYDLNILIGQAMITNTWYHYTITRKSSTGSKIYRNGTLLVSDTNTTNPVFHPTLANKCAIGALDYSASFGGVYYHCANDTKIDEIGIWNKELTSTEITELYNTSAGKFYPY